MLEAIGLSGAQAHAYQTLLRADSLTATELAGALRVPREEAIAAADSLCERQLAIRLPGPDPAWRAVPPRTGLTALLRRRQSELTSTEAVIEELDRRWRVRQPADVDPASLVEVLAGPEAISRRLGQLRASAQEILGLDRPPYFETDEKWPAVVAALNSRRIVSRTVYSHAALCWPGYLATIREGLAKPDVQARTLAELPVKLIIYDRRTALLPLTSGDADIVSSFVLLHGPALVRGLLALFETLWLQATPVTGRVAPGAPASTTAPRTGLSEQDHEVVRLLAAGLSDRQVAGQLGLSDRTLSRHVGHLMRTLGSVSRFQAGYAAARRRLL